MRERVNAEVFGLCEQRVGLDVFLFDGTSEARKSALCSQDGAISLNRGPTDLVHAQASLREQVYAISLARIRFG